jgi:pimeloyl-ACP methyl ester carboxylesterase
MLKVDPEERLAAYRKLQCPTLLVRGAESDVVAPEVAEQVCQAIPNCTLATVERAGHTVPGDNPQGFYQAVRAWLDSEKL